MTYVTFEYRHENKSFSACPKDQQTQLQSQTKRQSQTHFYVKAQKWLFVMLSHVTCHISNAHVDPWEMLNNFCFHVNDQKLLFFRCKLQVSFSTSPTPPSCECANHSAGSQLKITVFSSLARCTLFASQCCSNV